MSDILPALLLNQDDIDLEKELFDEVPLRIILSYCACFDSSLQQRLSIPAHVHEALITRFRQVLSGRLHSLDEAFGAKVRHQYKVLQKETAEFDFCYEYGRARRERQNDPAHAHTHGTKSDRALQLAADESGISEEKARKTRREAGRLRKFGKSVP